MVLKPAEQTPLTALELAASFGDAGLPPGVVNIVTGRGERAGAALVEHPAVDKIAFTGSVEVGKSVARRAAERLIPVSLELGGKDPAIVLKDADLDAAVDATLVASFLCAGQSCTAGERLLVHRDVREEFVARLAALVTERVVLGDPLADETTLGPLNNAGVAEKMEEHVADALERGASLVSGGAAASGFPTDLYWPATILDSVPADALVACEETFGPVAPVVAIDSLEHAIELTNASPYGLLAAIFTADLRKGLHFADSVRTGWVNVNESSNYWEPHLPFGGRAGTESGIGRVGGMAPMESFTELQTVVLS
jgi:succinate-semialdehyde dehydrogenase/glutarate-semialdehyde dehydrogenase